MPHPTMVDPSDASLADLRRICLRLPGAAEKVSHGRPCFFTKKVSPSTAPSARETITQGATTRSVLILAHPDEAAALTATPRFFVPAYWGPYGWIGLDLTAAEVDWDEVGELVTESFRLTAPRALVAQLERVSYVLGVRAGIVGP